jgi:hypothetical protein
MNNINFGRVVLGGLVAGLVLNVGEFLLNDVVLANQMKDFFRRCSIDEPGPNFIAVAVLMTFIMGLVIVWTYALIRPRLGPGPLTAAVAALILWFGAYVYVGVINGMLFGFPASLLLIVMVWGLVEYVLAAVAGAWVYKEA